MQQYKPKTRSEPDFELISESEPIRPEKNSIPTLVPRGANFSKSKDNFGVPGGAQP